jgi:hypothetical protein
MSGVLQLLCDDPQNKLYLTYKSIEQLLKQHSLEYSSEWHEGEHVMDSYRTIELPKGSIIDDPPLIGYKLTVESVEQFLKDHCAGFQVFTSICDKFRSDGFELFDESKITLLGSSQYKTFSIYLFGQLSKQVKPIRIRITQQDDIYSIIVSRCEATRTYHINDLEKIFEDIKFLRGCVTDFARILRLVASL